MRVSRHYIVLSALSGLVWGFIAYFLGRQWLPGMIWGGVIASPLIGLAIGVAFRRLVTFKLTGQIFLSLLSLYMAATLFALAGGAYKIIVYDSLNSSALWGAIGAVLYGLTFTGYFILLWPLAFLTHRLLNRIERPVR